MPQHAGRRQPRARPARSARHDRFAALSSASTRLAACGRSSAARPNAGAGIVVGVIDTGIWPENPSFAALKVTPRPKGWHGACVAGENFPSTTCNNKLIGARYYLAGFGKKNIAKFDYLSPRDGAGHGSHTSSTAAGNYDVPVTIDGNSIGTARAWPRALRSPCTRSAGTAPASPDGCFNSDSVAAINDAVADGVDVLNYSIGGTSRVDRARLGRAGVPRRVQRRRLRRQLGRQQRPRRQHARPPVAVADHGRRRHLPARLPGRRARQRRPLRRRFDHAGRCRP